MFISAYSYSSAYLTAFFIICSICVYFSCVLYTKIIKQIEKLLAVGFRSMDILYKQLTVDVFFVLCVCGLHTDFQFTNQFKLR